MGSIRTSRLKARVAIEQDGRILCVLHAKPDQEPFWCLPGGNVDRGESLTAGAARELREEVGIEVITAGAILIVDGPDAGAIEVILRGTVTAGTAARTDVSGDPYLAEVAWHPRTALPTTFRPLALRLLLEQTPVEALPSVSIAHWSS